MAKSTKTAASTTRRLATKVSRPGVHAKSRTSNHKSSKNYVKRNVGQG
jgi:hypothetical protein